MLQNAKVTAFTVFELLRVNQQGMGGKITPPPPPRLGLGNFQKLVTKKRELSKTIF